ncbi:DUF5711 family protein [Alkalithermobacter paradoxus]|uniref:Uncharacterized protein n=1 Tax=Alkalithermobacter paradoxus TaxID=29349 RepID=A0A1V4I666_9FIRM|nr:hypothetical protein CLOTH_15060 [[Clostridium] thermoalcaliphilum]
MKRNILITIFIILILLFNPKTLSFVKNMNPLSNGRFENIKEISFSYGANMVFTKYREGLLMYDGRNLVHIDNKGERIFNLSLRINDYSLDTNDNDIYILDKTSKEVYIIDRRGSISNRLKVNDNAVYIKCFRNGNFLIHYETDIELEGVKLFNSKGDTIKDISIPKAVINFVQIDNNTQGFLVSAINIENDSLFNNLFFYDRKGDLVVADKSESRVFIGSEILPREMFLIEPNSVEVRNRELQSLRIVPLRDNIRYINNMENGIGIIDDSGKLIHIDKNGQEKIMTYPIDKIKGFEYMSKGVAVYSDRSIYFDSLNQKYDFTKDIIKAISLDNDHLIVIFRGSIKFFKLM